MHRRWSWLGLGLSILVLVWCAACRVEARRLRATLAQVWREVEQGRHDVASTRLARLSVRGLGRGEVDYLLGICEQRLGHPDAALAAWARVPPRSPFALPALVRRGSLELERGRYADAEQALVAALQAPGQRAHEIRRKLAEVYRRQGRLDEARAVIEADRPQVGTPDRRSRRR